MNDERAILSVLLSDAEKREKPDSAIKRGFAAVDERDGDRGRRHGHADHLPLVLRDLVDEGVDRVVQHFHPARLVDLHRANHPETNGNQKSD